MKKFLLMLVAVSAVGLSACDPNTGQFSMNKQSMGTGLGAVAGGLAGAQFGKGSGQLWATGAGALLGALAGSSIGASLDRADLEAANRASLQANAAPIGQAIAWNNPQSGNSGTITPVRDGRDTAGRYCREYQQTVTVGGKKQSAYGTACQTPNGDWEIVK